MKGPTPVLVSRRLDEFDVRRRGCRCIVLLAAATAPLLAAVAASAQSAAVRGVVVEVATRAPIVDAVVTLSGTDLSALTDNDGEFVFPEVVPAKYELTIRHLAYGERSVAIEVTAAGPNTVRITLSMSAIELEPVSVEAFTPDEVRARGAGFRRNVVTREQIEVTEGTNMTMADVLRLSFPTVRVRRSEQIVGGDTCIELRTIRTTSLASACLSPAVFLDGVPITNPTALYGTLDPRMIERMEIVPASEAGARYGTGALYGALLIETRRPGTDNTRNRSDLLVNGPRSFDWDLDPRPHPGTRSFVFAVVGNAAGLALGLAAASQCIGTRAPSNDRIIKKCDGWPTLGAGAAALILPALGGGLGSRLGGRTDASLGRLGPTTVAGAMALVPGYALIIASQRSDTDSMFWLGSTMLTVGAPLIATLADKLFRSLRHREETER